MKIPNYTLHQSRVEICPECGKDYVIPIDWQEEGDGYYVALFCGWCNWSDTEWIDQDYLDAYEEFLDDTIEQLTESYQRLRATNFAEWVELFTRALENDAIAPFDFAS